MKFIKSIVIPAVAALLFAGCQTTAEPKKQPARKKSGKSSEAKQATSGSAGRLSGGWDQGLLDYGDVERSRQALDLH